MTIKFSLNACLRCTLACVLCMSGSLLFGQQTDTLPQDKIFDHFIGVQVNPLFRQIINFGDSDPVNNPYLVKYTLRHNNSGLSFNMGGGLNTTSTENDDGLKTNEDSYAFRGGFGYQKRVSKKIEVGVGLDLIYENTSRETFSVQVFDVGFQTDSTISKVRNVSSGFGGGLQVNLNYYLSERLLIGTECTLYYTKLRDRSNVEVDHYIIPNPGNSTATESRSLSVINEEDTGKSFAFLLPVAIYLSFKF